MQEYFPLIIIFFIFFSVFLFFMFSRDWKKLAEFYRTKELPPEDIHNFEFGSIGMTYYRGSLSIGISPKGLYLRLVPLLNFGLEPLLIPWNHIKNIESANSIFAEQVYIFPTSSDIKITIRKKVLDSAQKYLTENGINWGNNN
jgi:hypothetical protein